MPKIPSKTSLFTENQEGAAATGGDEVARFEDAIAELQQIVEKMEQGELKLEESLTLFERGMSLTRHCRASLDAAELKVRNLLAVDDRADES